MKPEHLRFLAADIKGMDREFRRQLINGLSGYKSLNLCGTISENGTLNLSLISSVIHVGANPPLMGMLIRPHTVPRHTLENIEANGGFTLNHVSADFFKKAHLASGNYPAEQSEFEVCGLTPDFRDPVSAPYVKESPLQIGLTLAEKVVLQSNQTVLLVGEVQDLIIPRAAIGEDGYLNLEEVGSLTIAGLEGYSTARLLERLGYVRVKKED